MEILDNMPHDRLYKDGKSDDFTHQAMIQISQDQNGDETLEELREPISDQLVLDFLEHLKTMPPDDHVSATHRLQFSGVIKRIKDVYDDYRYSDKINSNVFAPTAALYLFQHLNKFIPNHSLILADFDCFLEPIVNNSLLGINSPLVTNKLKEPTKWTQYDTYLIPRGSSDICFPSDFQYLKHAYQQITSQPGSIYKNKDFVDMFALPDWATTQNNYNPMREEYVNTSFLVTEYKK